MFPIEDLSRDVAVDYEALGMGATELVRNRSGLLTELHSVPFHTVRYLNQEKVNETGATYQQARYGQKRLFVGLNDNVEFTTPEGGEFDPLTAPIREFPSDLSKDVRKTMVKFKPKDLVNASSGEATNDPVKAATELFVLRRRPFTMSEVYGTPAGIQAQHAMLAMTMIDDYNLGFFKNKGVPQYAVILEGLTPPRGTAVSQNAGTMTNTEDRVKQLTSSIVEYFSRRLTTNKRSTLVVSTFGDAKLRFERLTSEEVEASFAEYEDRATEMIRRSHRIPRAAMGIADKDVNLGSGRDNTQMKRYRDHIVVPGQRMLETMINLIIRSGLLIPYFDFKFEPIDINEEEAVRDFTLKTFDRGIIDDNEARELLPMNLPPFKDEEGEPSAKRYVRGLVTFLSLDPASIEDALKMQFQKLEEAGTELHRVLEKHSIGDGTEDDSTSDDTEDNPNE
jgi:hypothetical protein